MEYFTCPVCQSHSVEHLLAQFKITASTDGDKRPVGGLAAYKCEEYGHIFFVRVIDADTWLRPVQSASLSQKRNAA